MASAGSGLPPISMASISIGFISFFFTILTWLGVYFGLVKTIRSAPSNIPLTLGNLRQEIQDERSMLREKLKEGDRYHVFPGRQMRRVGKNESHIRLIDTTLKQTWRSFRDLEQRFIVHGGDNDEESSKDGDSDSQFSDAKNYAGDEKTGGVGGRARDRRALRRRQSHLQSRMGMYEAGLSIDKCTYYNTDLWHRVIWWWKKDDVEDLQNSVQRLQLRRVQYDLSEVNSLVKRSLAILGTMTGEDPYEDCGEAKGPQNPVPGGGAGARRRRSRWRSKAFPAASSGTGVNRRSRDLSRGGVREVYEKEIRRTRRRSDSEESTSDTQPSPPSPRAKVAGSTISARSRVDQRPRSRAPSVVEYEVVNPGRIWVETVDTGARTSTGVSRPRPTHDPSYIRRRPSSGNMRQG